MSGILTILQYIFYYPIFNVLMLLYWLVHDFGLAIVLLTVLVRLALMPLTFKQLHSQRKLMELQPQINRLKEQYKGDQQAFARAQMQLMRENNVSMFGGCLPLLVQLPFLYGLFYALHGGLANNIANIQHDLYPFMQFTLSHGAPDTYLRWFAWLPGNPVLNLNTPDPSHVLPILAALFTFVSVRMMQGLRQQQTAQASPPSDPKLAAQQNAQTQMMSVMTYITPAITLWFAWTYAAGLSLYWVVSTLFGIVQQYFIYGWGGLFKGIKPLDEWAKKQDARREERRKAKMEAKKAATSTPGVVESTLASSLTQAAPASSAKNGTTTARKDGSASKAAGTGEDWIEQARAETAPAGKKRKPRPRPFVALVKQPQETTTPADLPQAEAGAEDGATKREQSSVSKPAGTAKAATPEKISTNKPKAGTSPAQRKTPPKNGSLPKPKGGKK